MHATGRHQLQRTRRSQSGGAAATRESHENRLGDIVLLVPQPQRANATPSEFTLKKRKTRHANLGLAGRFPSRRPNPADITHTERFTHTRAKPGIRRRGAPAQAMIKVQRNNSFPALRPVRP